MRRLVIVDLTLIQIADDLDSDTGCFTMDRVFVTCIRLSNRKRRSPCEVNYSPESYCNSLHKNVRYQGDMNRAKRDQAVRVFMSKNEARVMLMSLKCGGGFYERFRNNARQINHRYPGVGLNLTRANNVISLDLGWSQAIEAQSFDRSVPLISQL